MPLYEYECTECQKHTEKIQKFSDPEITSCPYCAGLLKRVISAPAFSLKGGGWYADGYGSAKPAAASSEAGSESGAKDGGPKEGAAKEAAPKTASNDAGGSAPATAPPPTAPAPAPAAPPAASSSKS